MAAAPRSQKTELEIGIGKDGLPVGRLGHVTNGTREYSSFSYDERWLNSATRFSVSPDLALVHGPQMRKPAATDDSGVFGALADTAPGAWARRVIARTHAAARQLAPELKALTELDLLCSVDDFSRVGALRVRRAGANPLASTAQGLRATAGFDMLERLAEATRALELGDETTQDLIALKGAGTSLGGARPKCSLLDADGRLALAKFASSRDVRSVPRGEVLAMQLARRAGIDTADAHLLTIHGMPLAMVRRFDRTAEHRRIPYLSAATMLQARAGDDHAWTELVDAINTRCVAAKADAQQLWRRLVFHHLIGNVDQHKAGFLYARNGLWRLAPAFDLNPDPDRPRETRTWLSEESGPSTSIKTLCEQASRFYLDRADALAVLAEVHGAVRGWRELALGADIGMSASEADAFAPAFEHSEMEAALALPG